MDEGVLDQTSDDGHDAESSEPIGEQGAGSDFRWRQTRENLLTPSGVRAFQLAYAHRDEEYESAKAAFDREYGTLSPRLRARGGATQRHGGYFATYLKLLEEMGLMHTESQGGSLFLRATPAGDQAAVLLTKIPNALRVVPYFIIELLSRYRFNNPLNTNPRIIRASSSRTG